MVAESAYTLEELIVLCSHRLQFRFLRKVSAKHSEREVQVTQTDEEKVDVSIEGVESRRPVGAVPVPLGRPDRVIIIGSVSSPEWTPILRRFRLGKNVAHR